VPPPGLTLDVPTRPGVHFSAWPDTELGQVTTAWSGPHAPSLRAGPERGPECG